MQKKVWTSRVAALTTAVAVTMSFAMSQTSLASSPKGTISMGVLSCFTGRLASLGEAMLQGSKVAQYAVNSAGGILGKRLLLAHADTGCDAADAVPATNFLLAKHVVGIIGPETQEIGSVEPILTRDKIPDEFQGGDTARDHQTNPYFWRDSPSDSQMGVAMALYAHNKGYKRAAMLFYTDVAAQTFRAPVRAAFTKLGGKIVSDVAIQPDQTTYLSEIEKVLASKPQVIFTQMDVPTAAVVFKEFKELDNLKIPFISTDTSAGPDFLKAITYPVAHAHLISIYGTSVTGQANDTFVGIFNKMYKNQQPLANANYAYDAVVSLALSIDKANSTKGPAIIGHMKDVTNPPGTQCYSYAQCLKLLRHGKKINYEGASGNLDYNKYNNTFGPYGAFRADLKGNEHQIAVMSAKELAKATP